MSDRTMAQIKETCDKACEILQRTNDGDDLDPKHLKLVEMAVNGFLNEGGTTVFNELYETVITTGYIKPFLHGIQHLTIDNVGYVYWKGKTVEHYELPWAYSDEARIAALDLERRCKILESRGVVPTNRTAIWEWNDSE